MNGMDLAELRRVKGAHPARGAFPFGLALAHHYKVGRAKSDDVGADSVGLNLMAAVVVMLLAALAIARGWGGGGTMDS